MVNRKAFSLTELLLIVGIVGIMSAILFPTFARKRVLDAKQMESLGRGERLAYGIHAYLADHDYVFPYGIGPSWWAPSDGGWVYSVAPYVSRYHWHSWMLSPDDPQNRSSWPYWLEHPDAVNISYVANGYMALNGATGSWNMSGLMGVHQPSWISPSVTALSEVTYPNLTVMVAEAYNAYPMFGTSAIFYGHDWWNKDVGFGGLIPDPTRDGSPYVVNGVIQTKNNRFGGINSVKDGKSKFIWADGHVSRHNPLWTNPRPKDLTKNLWIARRP